MRGRILVRIAGSLDEAMSQRVYGSGQAAGDGATAGLQPLHDLDQVRSFMSTVGPTALFDLPWMPLYLGICFLFHPWIGIAATAGGLLLVAVTLLTELLTRAPAREAARWRTAAIHWPRRAGAMPRRCRRWAWQAGSARWGRVQPPLYRRAQRAADVAGGLGGLSRVLRMMLQSAVLGIGA